MTTHPPIPSRARPPLLAMLCLIGVLAATSPLRGEVFHSRESALALAFGEDCELEAREIFLDEEEQARAGEIAGSPIPSRLVKLYSARRGEERLGWAYFETHRVRTLPETLLVVLRPDGSLQGVHVLAFHEPEAYLPHPRFLRQFEGMELGPELSLRSGVQGMAGSTFTARAVTAAVRRVLAVHEVAVQSRLVSSRATPPSEEVD